MNRFPFAADSNSILCSVEIQGSLRSLMLTMAVDTGASLTMIPPAAAQLIGCKPTGKIITITTGSRQEKTPLMIVPTFKAFGVTLKNLSVIVHTLPATSAIDGLLGLNFLKQAGLTIDFAKNEIRS